jgi:2-C-methyl-D-erythritol 2,4-cyclodiphosphate synthase
VRIPHPLGLQGHSDADVLCHAVGDALLGIVGKGDLGVFFPDTDPSLKGISSLIILERIGEMLRKIGYTIGNIDCTIIAQEPKMAPHFEEMRRMIASALKTRPEAVNIKATTTEGLGFTGRSEGIAAMAVALAEKD